VRFLRDRSGQGVLEYGLILGLLAMVAIGALLVLGSGSNSTFARAGHSISGDAGAATISNGENAGARTAPH
jgi:Flp pilus assembly pilin Flp